jgi:maltose alpha-D-glucosyltransferase / alpha-amylase
VPTQLWTGKLLDLWYKNAIIYSLNVATYKDGNGDGIGDFGGLIERLDHIAQLGVTCLWLLPFYPSPGLDHGYDVTDYYNVAPTLGTLGDFVEFSHQARLRRLRLIIDLPINHTSEQHPWFQQARADPSSPYRRYYVWSNAEPENSADGVIFPGFQSSVWTYDLRARAWYYHRFYQYQPDLDITCPAVREEIFKILGFWLELGVSGFRIDAARHSWWKRCVRTDRQHATTNSLANCAISSRGARATRYCWRKPTCVPPSSTNISVTGHVSTCCLLPDQSALVFGAG